MPRPLRLAGGKLIPDATTTCRKDAGDNSCHFLAMTKDNDPNYDFCTKGTDKGARQAQVASNGGPVGDGSWPECPAADLPVYEGDPPANPVKFT